MNVLTGCLLKTLRIIFILDRWRNQSTNTGILDPEESLICICFRLSNKEVSGSELEPSFLSPMEMEGGEWKNPTGPNMGAGRQAAVFESSLLPCKLWSLVDKEANWIAKCRAFRDAEMQINLNYMQLLIWGWLAKQRLCFHQAALETHSDG